MTISTHQRCSSGDPFRIDLDKIRGLDDGKHGHCEDHYIMERMEAKIVPQAPTWRLPGRG
jgi:hypothetical protein